MPFWIAVRSSRRKLPKLRTPGRKLPLQRSVKAPQSSVGRPRTLRAIRGTNLVAIFFAVLLLTRVCSSTRADVREDEMAESSASQARASCFAWEISISLCHLALSGPRTAESGRECWLFPREFIISPLPLASKRLGRIFLSSFPFDWR